MKTSLPRLLAGLLLCAAPWWAQAQAPATATLAYPQKTVRLVVPFNAGGPADALARALAAKLAPLWGQQVIVDNRSGGGSVIGWDSVAKAAPDGYTLLMAGSGTRTILPSIATLPFDPAKDLVPVTTVAKSPNLIVAGPAFPTGNLAELITQAKAQPGKLAIANPAPGTLTHFVSVQLQREAGITLNDIPYRGGAPAATALLGGEVAVMTADLGAVLTHIQSGKLRGLAVASAQRQPALRDVPTMQEAGIANLVADNTYGLFVPAGTPRELMQKIAAATATVIKAPELVEQFAKLGMSLESSTPEAFEAYLQAQTTRWGPVAKASGVKLN